MPAPTLPNIAELVQGFKEAQSGAQTMAQIWLNNEKEDLWFILPWLPEEVTVKHKKGNDSVDVIGLGEISLMSDRRLYELSFSSRFPARERPEMLYKLQPPDDYKNAMIALQNSKYPTRLVITETDINGFMTIEDFNWYHKGGDPGTIYYDITFREWREVTAREVEVDPVTKIATVPKDTPKRPDTRTNVRTTQTQAGDSLRSIAKKLTGDEENWAKIYDLNRNQIDNPATLPTGIVLQIPQ